MKTDLQLVLRYPIADVRRRQRQISFCSRDRWSRDAPTPPA